jgi:acyl carrier protein
LYASSETAALRSYFMASNTELPEGRLPVGYPIAGKSIELLDEAGHPVAFGETGEIVVRSPYLALGYWRRPEETTKKFLNDRRGGDERVFFTGDMGRMDEWGCLVYLGRKDQRIKVRGFAVDPLEVQRCLADHPAVNSAAVIGTPLPAGDLALVAYWVPMADAAPTTDELRRFMHSRLPNHAVPSRFVKLLALPRTASGKLDRRALPVPDRSRPDLSSSYLAPRNAIETELAALWGDILGIEPIGIDDDFFDLGGHSLAASRIIARVVQAFQVELPIKALFEAPTIAEMARIIERHAVTQASDVALNAMLSEIEAMTEGEAQRQLVEKSKHENES